MLCQYLKYSWVIRFGLMEVRCTFFDANKLSLKEEVIKICSETVIALDIGDIIHQYGKKFEKSALVKDGNRWELMNAIGLRSRDLE